MMIAVRHRARKGYMTNLRAAGNTVSDEFRGLATWEKRLFLLL